MSGSVQARVPSQRLSKLYSLAVLCCLMHRIGKCPGTPIPRINSPPKPGDAYG
eukprot:CAMPEP_0170571424 /NCGR_PEP_ID=MMETSP0224-20130122/1666_1 /TAXON_ID=285029 /ORGANISM="Togula jolla, Strain CCCM 725" /LENGTH=52 /DNA_ID=CAMNT_0010893827 /DNA_START=32 /DNA_END=190 /DNA_ORIENTATION=-